MAMTVEWSDHGIGVRVGKLVSIIQVENDNQPYAIVLTPKMGHDGGYSHLAANGDMIFMRVGIKYLIARGVTIPVLSDAAMAPSAPLPDAAKAKFSPRSYDIPIYGDY